ncbi:uncharacterized protein CLUP02_12202 [Colletotrichum lupini]|uniref:Uncharacterized protein n=1 Tax=Colletotrichum lupini TaxID=145971 RepID=A0A9Q8T0G5_9PEZI|nr:uncharacterized protein CLUP02_12202 [Colletotrichum lupini]UQC86700.1 hypothetical protein CLUP02_12202 [Colletotrichum lupini]
MKHNAECNWTSGGNKANYKGHRQRLQSFHYQWAVT